MPQGICRTALFGVLLTAALTLSGCSRRSEGSMAKGDGYFQKGDFRAASLEYRAVIARDGRNGAARQKLARSYRELGAVDQAWGEFVRAADLLPDDADAQLDAAESLLQTSQFKDAGTRAERVLSKNPKSVRAHTVKGLAIAGMNDPVGAVDEIQKALELDPTRATNFANLGALELARGRSDEAEAALKQAALLAPDTVPPKLALANFYWLSNRRDLAEGILKQAAALKPPDPVANRTLALLYVVAGRPLEAEAPLKTYADVGGPEAQLALADYYIGLNRIQDAIPVLEKVATIKEARAAAQSRLAGIDYIQNRRDAAYAKIAEILKEQPKNAQVLILKARWLLGEKRNDEALAAANAAVSSDSKSATAFFLLGNVRAARNEAPEAIAAYNRVLELNPRAVPAQLELARINTAVGKPGTAVQLASSIVASDPSNLDARLALVQGLIRQGDYVRAAREIKPLLAAAPKSAPVLVQAGDLSVRQRDLPAAATHFDHALAADPDSYEATVGRVNVSLSQKNTADAIRRVDARVARHPKDGPTLVLAGRTYAIAGDLVKAEALLRQAIDSDSGYMPGYHILGQVYVREKRLDEARERYEELVKRQPENVGAQTMVAMLLQVQNRPAEAKARYQKILQIDSRATVAANNLAYMNAEAGTDLDLALQLARTASSMQPDEPDISDTLGWVYYKHDMASLAVPPLKRSVEKVPANPTYKYHLGLAYLKTGEPVKGRQMLQEALKINPAFPEAADAKRALETVGAPR